jgi:hypothetical protein
MLFQWSSCERAFLLLRFYRMARRSATECAGILAIIRCLELAKLGSQSKDRELLFRIVAMLSKMVNVNGNEPVHASANANVHEVIQTAL